MFLELLLCLGLRGWEVSCCPGAVWDSLGALGAEFQEAASLHPPLVQALGGQGMDKVSSVGLS